MIAMRYGALPVVRRTGGLADTVFDANDAAAGGAANGFVFDGADEAACNGALDRAFALFRNDRKRFEELSRHNMDSDMSWRASAAQYHTLYREARSF
jgi:starch synthase